MAFKQIAQPQTLAERIELARRLKSEFELPMEFFVDPMSNPFRATFGDLPGSAWIINSNGKIAAKFPWAEPTLLANAMPTKFPPRRVRIPQ